MPKFLVSLHQGKDRMMEVKNKPLYRQDMKYVNNYDYAYCTTAEYPEHAIQPTWAIGDIMECEYCRRRTYFTPDIENCKGCGAPLFK